MEKKIIIFVLAASMLLMTGCSGKPAGKAEMLIEGKDYSIRVSSSVKKKECCICGDNERSLMAYYRKSNMLGLVFLNTMDMASLDTRIYSDDGIDARRHLHRRQSLKTDSILRSAVMMAAR